MTVPARGAFLALLLLIPAAGGDWSAVGHDTGRSYTTAEELPGDLREAWRRDDFGGWVVGGGLVFGLTGYEWASYNQTTAEQVAAVSVVTGALLWERDLEGAVMEMLYDDGLLFVSTYFEHRDAYRSSETRLYALLGVTGELVWEANLSTTIAGILWSKPMRLVSAGGLLVTATAADELVALAPDSGAVVWRQEFANVVTGFRGLSQGGTLLWMNITGALAAFNARNGTREWSIDLKEASLGFPALREGLLYVGVPGNDSRLQARNVSDGGVRWEFAPANLTGSWWGRPVVAQGLVLGVFSNTSDTVREYHLIAIDRLTGEEVWRAPHSQVTPIIAGSVVLTHRYGDEVQVRDLASGANLTAIPLPGAWGAGQTDSHSLMVSDNRLLLVTRESTLALGLPVEVRATATGPEPESVLTTVAWLLAVVAAALAGGYGGWRFRDRLAGEGSPQRAAAQADETFRAAQEGTPEAIADDAQRAVKSEE